MKAIDAPLKHHENQSEGKAVAENEAALRVERPGGMTKAEARAFQAADVVVLLYRAESELVIDGERMEAVTQTSSTWVRRGGEWRNVFSQETLVD